MIDYLQNKAKEYSLLATEDQIQKSIEYIKENIDTCTKDNKSMEDMIYHSRIVEYYYLNINKNEDLADLGFNASKVVKYLYRGVDDQESAELYRNKVKEFFEVSVESYATIDESTEESAYVSENIAISESIKLSEEQNSINESMYASIYESLNESISESISIDESIRISESISESIKISESILNSIKYSESLSLEASKEAEKQSEIYSSEVKENIIYVYVTKSGKKYHNNPNCSNMKNPIKISITEAKQSGRDACSNCY